MRFLQHALIALSLGLAAAGAAASPENPKEGVDYRTLDNPQQTGSAEKVEVIEFFWYACPHCNALEPALEDWINKQGDNVVFKRVPIAFRDSMVPQQKLYYTLEAMNKVDELHGKVFNTIHVQRKPLNTDEQITEFMVKQGIDKETFLDVYNSFGVQSKVRRAKHLQQEYKVDGVPLLAVDGRYLTSPSIVSASVGHRPEPVLNAAALKVVDWLVAHAEKDSKAKKDK